MTTSKLHAHVYSAGRLAAFIDELYGPMDLRDMLMLCNEANVLLTNDVHIPLEAYTALEQHEEAEKEV